MLLKKATRKAVKLKLNLSAPSGAGKTYSALRMAYGIVGDWTKIAVIDTENGSASLYSHLGEFNTIELQPPFAPEKYAQAIDICVNAGMELVILDSTTHEWLTLLDENQKLADAKFKGNAWSAWSVTTPRHDAFVNKVLHSPIHVITCTRSKTETILTENNGRKEVKKVGMKDQQRDGWEYELTVSLEIDRDTHMAVPSKDRTGLFEGNTPFIITEETGKRIADWCNDGLSEKIVAISEMEIVQSIDELKIVWSKYKNLQLDKEFSAMKDKRKTELSETTDDLPSNPEGLLKENKVKSINKEGAA